MYVLTSRKHDFKSSDYTVMNFMMFRSIKVKNSACTDCEYIEFTIAIIIIVILVRLLFLVDIMCYFG